MLKEIFVSATQSLSAMTGYRERGFHQPVRAVIVQGEHTLANDFRVI